MAIADGGPLVLAPSAAHFGEDPAIDDLLQQVRLVGQGTRYYVPR